MRLKINGKENISQEVREIGDFLITKNCFPLEANKKFLVDIGAVNETRYHRLFQAFWLLAQDGYDFKICVKVPVTMVGDVRRYIEYLELEEHIIAQWYDYDLRKEEYEDQIVLTNELDSAIVFMSSGHIIENSTDEIYYHMKEYFENKQ